MKVQNEFQPNDHVKHVLSGNVYKVIGFDTRTNEVGIEYHTPDGRIVTIWDYAHFFERVADHA